MTSLLGHLRSSDYTELCSETQLRHRLVPQTDSIARDCPLHRASGKVGSTAVSKAEHLGVGDGAQLGERLPSMHDEVLVSIPSSHKSGSSCLQALMRQWQEDYKCGRFLATLVSLRPAGAPEDLV